MAKPRKGKIIKRVYEKGRETLVPAQKDRPRLKKTEPVVSRTRARKKYSIPTALKKSERSHKTTEHAPAYTPPPKPVSSKPFTETYDLPQHYGTTRVTLMVKDPFWIYAYWEVARGSVDSLRGVISAWDMERASRVLRVYDVTLIDFNGSNANNYFDIDVGADAANWYISSWRDSVSYIAEIGLRLPDGRFFALARSNHVHTPRSGYSPRSEQMWMRLSMDGPQKKPPYVTPLIKTGRGGATPEKRAFISHRKRKYFYLTEEEIKRYYSGLSPLLREIISARFVRTYEKKIQGKKRSFSLIFVLEGDTDEERHQILSRLPGGYFIRKTLLGSSEEVVLLGASERHARGPGGASEFVHEKIRQRKFFFELNAELIVYGRTEPDAEVYLGDKKIPLRGDGTFSLRFALPDGKIPLGFTAVSKDKKEHRKIHTSVERVTRCGD